MLALLGFIGIALFTVLVMTNRLSAVAALIIVPVIIGALAGFGTDMGQMMVNGIIQTAPTAVMLVFALLYFLVMYESGLFEPLVRKILQLVGDDPLKVVLGTLALIVVTGLDGDGATTTLITATAMYPVYRRVGVNPLVMAVLLGLTLPVMNWLPWGGPAARAAISLKVPVESIVGPMLPAMAITLAAITAVAFLFGRSERRRLAGLPSAVVPDDGEHVPHERQPVPVRNFWFNLLLTIVLMAGLATGIAPLPAIIMVAFAVAATVNLPRTDEQQERLKAHGGTVAMLITLILAAGAFTGVFSETKMIEAMAKSLVSSVPAAWGPYFGYITGLLSMPLLIILSTDAFFLGVLPILGHTGAAYGVPPEVIARAALVGMPCHSLSPLIAPIYFIAALLRTDIGSLQRFGWPWAILISLAALVGAALTGAVYAV